MDEILTVADVAERLKVNPQTVRNWIDRGDLRGFRAGPRRVRVRASDLDDFLDQSEVAAFGDPAELRDDVNAALATAQEAASGASDAELALALWAVARAANRMAAAIERQNAASPPHAKS